ncbi:MAG TPA: PilZ domain-containing protein [Lichenihabitans sp.]|jgi:hypothetical protein|nr:PilZ domain-containing protein [Lichenihabitans sp.]
MHSRRRSYRKKTYLAAFATRGGDHPSLFCMVRDLSPQGARLSLLDGRTLPDTLDLEINGRAKRLHARVVWRRDDEVGVIFLDEAQAGPRAIRAAGR